MKECHHKHHWIGCVAMIILIIGGLNWGLVGIFDFNLVHFIFGRLPVLEHLIYILVGLSALYWIYGSIVCCKHKCRMDNNGTYTPPPTQQPPL